MHTPFSCHAVNNRAAGVIVFVIADAVPDSVTKVCGVRRENLSGTRVQPLIVEHITRHGEQIRAPRSDLREECVEVLHGEECTEVHVADLRDHHTRRLGRQMRNGDHIVMPHGLMSFNKCAVTTEQQARCRIECRIFQHAPPLRIVRHTARLSPDEPHRHGKHDKRKCNQLCNEQKDDRQGNHACPAIRPMGTEQEEQSADAAELKERNADACRAETPPLRKIAQEIEAEREQCEDNEQEYHQKDKQRCLLICQSPVIMETNGIVATEISVESAMISVIRG